VVREIDEFVLGESRVERDIQQARESLSRDRRKSGDQLGIEHAVANDPKTAGPFGDENVAIG
jgi:hypothetical protein